MKKSLKRKLFLRVLSLTLVMVMVVLLGACGGNANKEPAKTDGSKAMQEEGKSGDTIKIAMLPKFKGENYFDAAKVGAEEAVEELNKNGANIEFLYDGPPQDQATNQKQVDIIEGWIGQSVNVILVSSNDPTAIADTLKKAQEKGIKVLTFDADAQEDARDLFVNQVVAEGVAQGLVEGAAKGLKEAGYGPEKPANLGLISSSKTDANQQSWVKAIKELLATEEYSWIKIQNEDTDIYYPGPDETSTQADCGTLISRMGPAEDQIQCAIGLSSMATPALGAQYQSVSQKPDPESVVLTGLATPNALKSYILDDTNPMKSGVLWNVIDLGYLAIQAGYQMAVGDIDSSSTQISAGRLGDLKIADKMLVLGPAMVFTKDDVENYNY